MKPRFRPSLAETKRQNQNALDYYRALSAKPDAPRIEVGAKEKRERSAPGANGQPLERDVLRAVLQLLRVHPLVAWASRINSGAATDAAGNFVRFNQIAGCSDVIGQMKPLSPGGAGAFLALEVKRPGQKPTEPQMLFLRMVQANGGCAGWCDSVEACEGVIRAWAQR